MAGAADKPADDGVGPARPRSKCPVCGKPSDRALLPFCSKRCAMIDLNRWLSGSYAIPAVEEDDPETDEGEGDDRQA